MKVLLVYPRFKYPTGDPPLGILYIASTLRQAFPRIALKLFDATFQPSFQKISDLLSSFKPDLVGIYCNTIMFAATMKIAKMAKSIGAFVVIGGPHASILPRTLLAYRCIDAVVVGEGERSIVELVRAIQEGNPLRNLPGIMTKYGDLVENKACDVIENLDEIPFPAFDLVDMENYISTWFQMDAVSSTLRGTNVIASRGCPFHCSYCQPTLATIFGDKVRIRSPENVVAELSFLKKTYQIQAFVFEDDTPTFFKEWISNFCDLLIQQNMGLLWGCNTRVGLLDKALMHKMHDAGFRRMMVGFESANQRVLDQVYRKGIKVSNMLPFCELAKQAGLSIFGYFMIGAPTETLKECKKTIDLAFMLPIDEATFSITTPLPETGLAEFVKTITPDKSISFSRMDYYTATGAISDIPAFRLRWLQRIAFLKFYLHPRRVKVLMNVVKSPASIRKGILKLKRIVSI